MSQQDLLMKRGAGYRRDRRMRWTLTREWGDGPRVCYIGHNPSTAGHEKDDPTSAAWVRFATGNGFGSYIAVNLYPLRTAKPGICRNWLATGHPDPDLAENARIVAGAIRCSDIVVACWGGMAADRGHIAFMTRMVGEAGRQIFCLGETADGSPKHPMARGVHRILPGQQFMPWRGAAGRPGAVAAVQA